MRIESIVVAGCLTCFLASEPAFAKLKEKSKPKTELPAGAGKSTATYEKSAAPEASKSEPLLNVDVTISTPERIVIRQYVEREGLTVRADNGKKLPPGLAKKVANGSDLPPGWQKKCVRGEVMPRLIYDHCHPLPGELVAQLPPQPQGTILVAVEGKIVRLAKATREVLDIFGL